ncbi:MAG TPA: hypothetical protein VHL11_24350 [Phototrophicaceae bacterium]|jgi:myosin heavy subunit|nr:hypothetical protein [Phototrophicaceae bacterium]
MNDLLKKLNTLVSAKLNDITPNLPRFERTPDMDRQVNELRQRINEALEHEDQLQATAQALRAEVARLDALADEALAQGQEAEARHLLEQMKRAEQRLSFAESDLKLHQRSAEELIQRVNMLEATVADVKHARQEAAKQEQTQPRTPDESDETEPLNPAEAYAKPARDAAQQQAALTGAAVERISTLIKDTQERTREKINQLGRMLNMPDVEPRADPTPAMRPADVTKPMRGTKPDEVNSGTGDSASVSNPADTPASPLPKVRPVLDPDDPRLDNVMPRPKKPDDDDELAQRVRRLSKPE